MPKSPTPHPDTPHPTLFIALLRGINVGGTGILPMRDLVTLCRELGLTAPRTYIQSGNILFGSTLGEPALRQRLEAALHTRLSKAADTPTDVMIRTGAQLAAVLAANPFPGAEPNKVQVAFLHHPLPAHALHGVLTPSGEQLRLGTRELYIHYPEGIGRSKLKLPLSQSPATLRNLNTIAKLVALAQP